MPICASEEIRCCASANPSFRPVTKGAEKISTVSSRSASSYPALKSIGQDERGNLRRGRVAQVVIWWSNGELFLFSCKLVRD